MCIALFETVYLQLFDFMLKYFSDEGGNNVIVKQMIIAPLKHSEIVIDLTGGM